MNLSGSQRIGAVRDKVWAALNDPETLKLCIPGCTSIEKISETEMKATSTVKVGPMKITFSGKVLLSDVDPPNSYSISGEGIGGVAGHVKGRAVVRLESIEEATVLFYEAHSQIGGKLAQLGARLIDSTAKKYARDFFEKFGAAVSEAPT